MTILVTPEWKASWQRLVAELSGGARRLFMASLIKAMGRGAAAVAERELG